MIEVRRDDDGELCGFVDGVSGRWHALTVFGGQLGAYGSMDDARAHVLDDGLRVLADRWTLVDGESGDEEVVCIQQCSPSHVTLALGYSSIPGTPSMTIQVTDLQRGRWRLDHRP